jgi:hypothetical protein
MRKTTLLCFIVFFLGGKNTIMSQNFAHELGVIAGATNFRSDFGERGNMETNLKNTGYGVGLIHYFNFAYRASCSCFTELTYFNDHFKLRSELSYYWGDLGHYGQWADRKSTSALFLREMKGTYEITNAGMQLEYYPMSIREFGAGGYTLSPFFALGLHYSFYSPNVYSTLGKLGSTENTHPKYIDGALEGTGNKGGAVLSTVASLGARYKIAPLSDLIFELRWQYYMNDWVDGLNPDPAIYQENIANDWIVWFNLGYVYTFL